MRYVNEVCLPDEKGGVICNSRYGERLRDLRTEQEIYETMGKVFSQGYPHRYYIISPDMEFEKSFGRMADKRRKLYNGMIPCQLYMYFKEEQKKAPKPSRTKPYPDKKDHRIKK